MCQHAHPFTLKFYPITGYTMKSRPLLLTLFFLLLTVPTLAKKKVIFEPPRGFYTEPFQLTMTSPVENATIKYTLNGTDP